MSEVQGKRTLAEFVELVQPVIDGYIGELTAASARFEEEYMAVIPADTTSEEAQMAATLMSIAGQRAAKVLGESASVLRRNTLTNSVQSSTRGPSATYTADAVKEGAPNE